jgi:hypothetical protein
VAGLALDVAVLKVLGGGEQQRLLLAEHDHVLDARLETLARIEEERALALAQHLLAKVLHVVHDRVADHGVLAVGERGDRHLADDLLVHVGNVRRRLVDRHQPLVAGGAALAKRVLERGERLEVHRLLVGEHVRVHHAEHLLVHVGQKRARRAPQPLLARLVAVVGAVDKRQTRAQLERRVLVHNDRLDHLNHLHGDVGNVRAGPVEHPLVAGDALHLVERNVADRAQPQRTVGRNDLQRHNAGRRQLLARIQRERLLRKANLLVAVAQQRLARRTKHNADRIANHRIRHRCKVTRRNLKAEQEKKKKCV